MGVVGGLTSTLLVYGVYTKLPLSDSALTSMTQHEHFQTQKLARDEYANIVDEKRLSVVHNAKCLSV